MKNCEGKVDAVFSQGNGLLVELILGEEAKTRQKFLFPTNILPKKLGADYPIQRGDSLHVSYSGKDNRVKSYSKG